MSKASRPGFSLIPPVPSWRERKREISDALCGLSKRCECNNGSMSGIPRRLRWLGITRGPMLLPRFALSSLRLIITSLLCCGVGVNGSHSNKPTTSNNSEQFGAGRAGRSFLDLAPLFIHSIHFPLYARSNSSEKRVIGGQKMKNLCS